jgi:ubiquinone/menaquinone biosynthesis C-methylase UbiE
MIDSFRHRSLETERLDRGEYTESEFTLWEKEMWMVHRFFGEVRALRKTVLTDIANIARTQITVLELAAGSGRLLKFIRESAIPKELKCVGLELSQESANSIEENGLTAVRADATELPFADDSFDLVFCTLFLHHLSDAGAASLLREMHRVASRKIYVIDLDRRAVPYYLYKLFGTMLLQRFTRDDGALSIKRAFSPTELRQIAKRSGLRNVEIERSAINRLVLTAEV